MSCGIGYRTSSRMRPLGARAESNRLVDIGWRGRPRREAMQSEQSNQTLVGLRQSATEINAFFAGGPPVPHEHSYRQDLVM